MKMLAKIFILPIRFYRYFISPLFPPSCRFTPTCSQYAIEVILEKGIIKGTYLSIIRISKCHPLGSKGYDPVPGKEE